MPSHVVKPIDAKARAIRAWMRIQRRPTSVTLVRGSTPQTPQTMRVEIGSGGNNADTPAGMVGTQSVVLYGISGHPSEADTDVKRLDRVILEGLTYTIEDVIHVPGEIQAFGTVKSK